MIQGIGGDKMLRFTNEAIASLRKTLVYVLEIEIPALILYTYVIFPSCRMVLNYIMRSQGYAYFTDANIGSVFQNIWILLTLIFIVLLLGFCFFIEIVLLMAAIRYENRVFHGLRGRCGGAVKALFSPFGVVIIICSFFVGIVIHLNLFITLLQSIGYVQIKDFIADKPLFTLPVGLALIIFAFIFLRTLFVYPLAACEGVPLRKSFAVSARLMKGHYIDSIGKFLFVNVIVFVLFALIYLVVMSITVLVVIYTQNIGLRYAVSQTVMDTANKALIFIYTVALVSVNMVVVMILRRRYADKSNEDLNLVSPDVSSRKRKTTLHQVVSAGMLCLLIAFILLNNDFLHNFRLQTGYDPIEQKPEIIAHRGNSFAAPENTLAALRSAIEEKADSAEIDVRMTKDGELILMHDRSFLRTCGVDAYVSQLSYSQIADFDAGSWFSPEFRGERIPTLRQALEFCKGEITLMIEIKSEIGQEHDMVLRVMRDIEEAGMEKDVIVASFSLEVLREVKQLSNSVVTCLILRFAYGNISGIDYVDMFSIELKYVRKTIVQNIKTSGKAIVVWTVNDSRNLSLVRDLRVDAIITDLPIRARRVLYEGAVTSFLYKTIAALTY